MTFAAKDANGAIVQLAQPTAGPGVQANGTLVTLPTDGNHAKTADISALQSALLTALGLLATDQDVMATNAKLEAIRLLLASPAIPTGASTDASVQAITAKLEAVRLLLAAPALASGAAADTSVQAVTAKAEAIRALLAGTLAITATALPLPAGAAKDATLSAAYGTLADAATPDITATGASFTFTSLFKGMVANLKALAGKLPASLGAQLSAGSLSIAPATDAVFATAPQASIPNKAAAGTLTNINDAVQVAVAGMATAVIQVAYPAGATGTAVFEASADNGASWAPVNMIPYAGGAPAGSATASGLFEMACGGLDFVRVRASTAIASGPLAVVARATAGAKSIRVGNPVGNPLTNSEQPVQGIIDMPTAATAYTAGRAIEIVCSTAGALTLTYADGSTRTRTFSASTTPAILSGAVTQWSLPSGSAFAGTVCNLK